MIIQAKVKIIDWDKIGHREGYGKLLYGGFVDKAEAQGYCYLTMNKDHKLIAGKTYTNDIDLGYMTLDKYKGLQVGRKNTEFYEMIDCWMCQCRRVQILEIWEVR